MNCRIRGLQTTADKTARFKCLVVWVSRLQEQTCAVFVQNVGLFLDNVYY